LAAGRFQLGFDPLSVPAEDVREDVMAQRGELAARIQGDPFTGELDRLVQMLFPIEIGFRQE
jgi:hypothetical protein